MTHLKYLTSGKQNAIKWHALSETLLCFKTVYPILIF